MSAFWTIHAAKFSGLACYLRSFQQQKQILGERLYPLVGRYQPGPDQGKITGMMLDMEPSELLMLLENEEELRAKVAEAVSVLNQAKAESVHQ